MNWSPKSAPDVDVNVRPAGWVDVSKWNRVVLAGESLRNADYSGQVIDQFSSAGCRFEKATFDGATVRSASFGAGRTMSEYFDCSFDRARLEMGPGGRARFVNCSFDNVRIIGWMCKSVELVDCIFSGRLQRGVFRGDLSQEDRALLGREHNEFRGNDFSRMELVDVAFRGGIDLSAQVLPDGPNYILLEDAPVQMERARERWGDLVQTEPPVSLPPLVGLEGDLASGQKQILIRVTDYSPRERDALRCLFAS